jgi:hypothetical protein
MDRNTRMYVVFVENMIYLCLLAIVLEYMTNIMQNNPAVELLKEQSSGRVFDEYKYLLHS